MGVIRANVRPCGWRKQREKQHYGVAVISMQPWPGLISNQYADLFARGRGGLGFFGSETREERRRVFCKLIQCVFSFNVCFVVYHSCTSNW